jgi:hypothetical protein
MAAPETAEVELVATSVSWALYGAAREWAYSAS